MDEDYALQAFLRASFAIKRHKEASNEGITIILGAGCSLNSSMQDITTEAILTKCLRDNYNQNYVKPDSWEQLYQDFINKLWSHKGEQEKTDMLSRYLGYLRPSKGYQYLQKLTEAGFIKTIITTNFDMMTDFCCNNVNVEKWVVDKKVIRPKSKADVTLLKVHGDLENKMIRFAPDELRRLPEKTENLIRKLTHNIVILIGWKGQDGGVLDSLDISSDYSCYWVAPDKPNEYECMNNGSIMNWMNSHNSRMNFIYGEEYGYFDKFMEKISQKLLSSKIIIEEYNIPKIWRGNTIIDIMGVNHNILQSFLKIISISENHFKKYKWNITMPFYAKDHASILKAYLFFFHPGQIPEFMLQIPNNEMDAMLLGLALELRTQLKGFQFPPGTGHSKLLLDLRTTYEALEYNCIFSESFWEILLYLINPNRDADNLTNIVEAHLNPDNHLFLRTSAIPIQDIKELLDTLELLTFFAPTCSVSRKEEIFNTMKCQLEKTAYHKLLLEDCVEIIIDSLTEEEFYVFKRYLDGNMSVHSDHNSLKGRWIHIYTKQILPSQSMNTLPTGTLFDTLIQYSDEKTKLYLDQMNILHTCNTKYIPLSADQELEKFRKNNYYGLFIIGPSGCGKTSALKQFVKTEVENGNLCIPLISQFCNLHAPKANIFLEEIFPEGDKNLLYKIHEACDVRKKRLFFIIDGLNEFSNMNIDSLEIYRFLLQFSAYIVKEDLYCFKLIISCRDISFFYYIEKTKLYPSLHEFMNFLPDDAMEPVPYYRVQSLSLEEKSRLCALYFKGNSNRKMFENYLLKIREDHNILSPFFIAAASTLSLKGLRNLGEWQLYEKFATRMLSNIESEFEKIAAYKIFDIYFRYYIQNKSPITYFYLFQEFEYKDQNAIREILRKLAEVNLIKCWGNSMSDTFKFLHDRIEEYFLYEFLVLNLNTKFIIPSLILTEKHVVFREGCICFMKYLYEQQPHKFADLFKIWYTYIPDILPVIVGKSLLNCSESTLERFLGEGACTREIIQNAAYGILTCVKSYEPSITLHNIEYLIERSGQFTYLKSMVPFFRYIITLYHVHLTANYAEAEKQTSLAMGELENNPQTNYLYHNFQVIRAIILRNQAHVNDASKLLEESYYYFMSSGRMEEAYTALLEWGCVLREKTDFELAISLYRKAEQEQISQFPNLHQQLILQEGIIYKNKMQELLYSYKGEAEILEQILYFRNNAIQMYETLISKEGCNELKLIEAETELAETLIFSYQVIPAKPGLEELINSIRDLLHNIIAPHRTLQFMRVEANYYELQNNIPSALDLLHRAKDLAQEYKLPFRIFECDYQIAHMIQHHASSVSKQLLQEGLVSVDAAIHFCETELNGSQYLKNCIQCKALLSN